MGKDQCGRLPKNPERFDVMIHFELVLPGSEDGELIRVWRNDPVSLEMSATYTQGKSFHEFYPEFLRNYFSFPELPSLFAVFEGKRIGVLRFDPAVHSRGLACEISLLVAPQFRQKGLGVQILQAVDPFLARQGIHVVHAKIKPHNIASIKSFTRAGYSSVPSILQDYVEMEKVTAPPQANKVFIIAEAGSNWHSGNDGRGMELAFEMIEAAKEAGADAVKFQTFKAADTYVPNPGSSDYLAKAGIQEDIRKIFEELSLSDEMVHQLAEHAKKVGIEFLSSAFSPDAFALIDPLVKRHKIASYEIGHTRLLELAARSGKPLILSTGAATPAEIDWAVDLFKKKGGTDLTLLQCTAKYPAPKEDMNLRVIPWLKQRYQVNVGLSDHSFEPLSAPLAAAALGATCIEKHFTLSRTLIGPDHAFAIEPHEFKQMVRSIREVEIMLGSSVKRVEVIEEELYFFAKRGIQSLRDIRKGEILSEGENIAILRPGKRSLGLHPKHLPNIQGKIALKDIQKGEGIQFDDI
jgi:sialic acid synthase SpsE/RimJ/RimL family protein N-acetyltransferase